MVVKIFATIQLRVLLLALLSLSSALTKYLKISVKGRGNIHRFVDG